VGFSVRTRSVRRALGAVAVALALVGAGAAVELATAEPALALGNGLALTPPMGWNDWNTYGCGVTEALVKATADKIVSSGMAAAGYQYVDIDDCWMQKGRDANDNLQPDTNKFPDGIIGTAAYVHSLGLKLGIYESAGKNTCADPNYPGSLGHETADAKQFAAWGVDLLKYDNCGKPSDNTTKAQYIARYSAMRDALAASGRPIVYSICEWGVNQPWTWGGNVGNMWRTTGDITATFSSLVSIFHQNMGTAPYGKPGAWNDPDMLEVGRGMTATEDQAEFSLWSEMAAPLLAGNDLVGASAATLATLTNPDVIAVDQDSLGRQGYVVRSSGGLDVLAKPLANGDVSVVLFNETAAAATISTTAAAIGKSGAGPYALTDLWSKATSSTTGAISASVPAHGVVMYRVSGGTTTEPTSTILRSTGSQRCLDAYNNETTEGTKIEVYDCNGGANQLWSYTPSKQLTSMGRCLDVYDNKVASGTIVELWDCNGQANQQWNFNADGTITGVQSGLCLDVKGAATATNGTQVEIYTCLGGSNQKWTKS
jgi:alpha-galactosidase